MKKKITFLSFDEAIESLNDKSMQPKLMKFMAGCNSKDNVRIAESKDYIEIIVAHQSYSNSDGETFSGGAEQYILDKKTGEIDMGWHEHPMRFPCKTDTVNFKKKN